MVDKRRSSEYKELRGFIPKSLTMEFKAACKQAGQNINDTLEEAVKDWINMQEQSLGQRSQNVVPFQNSSLSPENLTFSSLPTIATAIEKTLENPDWGLKHLAKEAKISVTRLKKLLSGDRPSDEEIEKLAGCLIRLNGTIYDEEELNDMRLVEDLKQRHLRRERKRKLSESDRGE